MLWHIHMVIGKIGWHNIGDIPSAVRVCILWLKYLVLFVSFHFVLARQGWCMGYSVWGWGWGGWGYMYIQCVLGCV